MSTVVLVIVDVISAFPILVVKTVVTSLVDGVGDVFLEAWVALEASAPLVGDGEDVGEPVEVAARVHVGARDVESSVDEMDMVGSDRGVVVSSVVVTV